MRFFVRSNATLSVRVLPTPVVAPVTMRGDAVALLASDSTSSVMRMLFGVPQLCDASRNCGTAQVTVTLVALAPEIVPVPLARAHTRCGQFGSLATVTV